MKILGIGLLFLASLAFDRGEHTYLSGLTWAPLEAKLMVARSAVWRADRWQALGFALAVAAGATTVFAQQAPMWTLINILGMLLLMRYELQQTLLREHHQIDWLR